MSKKNDALLRDIRKRFDGAVDADRENRKEGMDDLHFLMGEQWPDDVKRARENELRPVITVNTLPAFVRQVTGDIRATNPAIRVVPSDAAATEDLAEMMNGIIRNIEYQSDGSSVYERAAESAAQCSIGHFRILTQERAGAQEIYLESIPNPFAVYWDPMAKDPTRKDARFCFVTDRVDIETFKEQYPKANVQDFEGETPEYLKNWYADNTVVIAEYFWKDGESIMWCKVAGADILEAPQRVAGKHIPVLAVVGEEVHMGDRVVRTSVIRFAKDSQRLYNYFNSAQAEIVAMQPKAPYKVTPKQISGHEGFWDNANTENLPYLLYNSDPENPGPPQREAPPVPSSGFAHMVEQAREDMRNTTGIHQAALGEQSNETSGVAIKQRQLESDISTSIYVDNLSKSIAQCGRVLVSMIPEVYDTQRVIQIVGEDGTAQPVGINQMAQNEAGPLILNPTGGAEYDIRIKTGPSYTTQRQESVESMLEFVRAFPQAAAITADIVARNMDWPGADELADRLVKMVSGQFPGLIESDEPPTPEEQQAQQAAAQQEQAQAAMQQQMQQAEVAKAMAEADEATAQAQEARLEVSLKELELAIQSGQLDGAIQEVMARSRGLPN